MKITLVGLDGKTALTTINATAFYVVIAGEKIKLCYHDSLGYTNETSITEPKSGKRVCSYPKYNGLNNTPRDNAINAVTALAARVGDQRFLSVLRGA